MPPDDATARSLIVGFDGTWNQPEQTDDGVPTPTNVVKFLRALTADGGRQVQHYEEGVGTGNWEALAGGLYGYGLEMRIQGAYRFLRRRFADADWPRESNRVFLLGFSRGAYTARRVAGMLHFSGIPVSADDCELGWDVYANHDVARALSLKDDGRFFDVPIEALFLWDTVKATNDPDYGDDLLSPNVHCGYHAMALDERRKFFPVVRWRHDPRVQQAWFAGTHSDVGGGYRDAGLSDAALKWMIVHAARHHGLRFDPDYTRHHIKPDPLAPLHESLLGMWTTFGIFERPVDAEDAVHASVKERLESPTVAYAPGNLPDDPTYTA